MNRIGTALLAFSLLLSSAAQAQTQPSAASLGAPGPTLPPFRALTVAGTAYRDFVADLARLAISLTGNGGTAVAAEAALFKEETRVEAAARGSAGPELVVSRTAKNLSANNNTVAMKGSGKMWAATEIMVLQGSASTGPRLLDAVSAALRNPGESAAVQAARESEAVTFAYDTSKRQELYQAALAEAATKATAQANALAIGLNVQIDRLEYIDAGPQAALSEITMQAVQKVSQGPFALLFGGTTPPPISASVNLVFRLK
ncbi:MAG: SIMPL domain-containing protein [Candidatus Eremiobacteraeota bacterium]|nr:SIMPL domain-containing protein [Candidatus Eremiobacteraeota bacterium]